MTGARGTPTKVFISYRHDDSAPYAGRIHDRVADALGRENLVKDVDSFGLDFAEAIRAAVSSCDVLLAIIGPDWLTISGRVHSWLNDPDDSVRIEIETAFACNVRVVPVLVDGAELPAREDLPESLQPLLQRRALRLSHDEFNLETQNLLDDLARLSDRARLPPPVLGILATGLPPPPAAQPPTAPSVRPLVEKPRVLTLLLQLGAQHVIEVDNDALFGLIKVDGQQVVKRADPEGTHTLVLDDKGTRIVATLSFRTTWGGKLKDVVLRIGDQIVYQNDRP